MTLLKRRADHDLGPDWRRLWAAGGISTLGDGAFGAALPLLAVSFTTNPRLVAGVAAFGSLPWLLCSLHAGALADRLDRRRLMWVSQLVQSVLVLVLTAVAVAHAGGVWLLYLVAFGMGAAETVFGNAAQAMLPSVVPPGALEAANGRQYATETVTELFVGPPLGAWLFAAAAALPFGLDAASFLVSVLLIMRIRAAGVPRRAGPRRDGARPSVRQDIAEGLRWLYRHRLLRTLALLLAATNLAGQLVWSTMVLYVTRELHVGERWYGLMLTGTAVGGVLGGLVGRRLVAWLGTRGAVLAGAALGTVAVGGTGFIREAVALPPLMAVMGFGATIWNVATVSLRQRIVPDHLRGRVNSAYRLAGWGSMPVGAALGGIVAAAWGLAAPWLVAGAIRLGVLAVILIVLRPGLFDAAAPPAYPDPSQEPASRDPACPEPACPEPVSQEPVSQEPVSQEAGYQEAGYQEATSIPAASSTGPETLRASTARRARREGSR